MKLTAKFIESNFHKFNEKYFRGEIDPPAFEVMHTKTTLGQCAWRNKVVNGEIVKYNYRLRVSDYYNRSEYDYQNTILHEMIHLYIRQKNLTPASVHHGFLFKSMARRINQHGWNVSRTDSVMDIEAKAKGVKYHVIAFKDRSNRPFIMCYNPRHFKTIMKMINSNDYTGVVNFVSKDSAKYSSYPVCRKTLRGRYVSMDEYNDVVNTI